jgi:hypothetical protein
MVQDRSKSCKLDFNFPFTFANVQALAAVGRHFVMSRDLPATRISAIMFKCMSLDRSLNLLLCNDLSQPVERSGTKAFAFMQRDNLETRFDPQYHAIVMSIG